MPVYSLNFAFEDTENDPASVSVYCNVADETAAATVHQDLGIIIGALSGCRLSGGSISRPITETALAIMRTAIAAAGGARPLSGAGNDASHGVRFLFTHGEGDTKYTIPGFRDALMNTNAKTANLADTYVDAFVDYIVNGTIVDYRGSTVVLLNETYETWAGKPA